MRRIAAALLAGVLFLTATSGCGKAGGAEPAPEASPDLSAALGEEEQALFHQILLFLQEGFRDHRVEDSYTVFFPPPEDRNGRISLALWDGQDYYLENISYTYDQKKDWYTFRGEYEPVLTGADTYVSFAKEIQPVLDPIMFQAELSAETELPYGIRYTAPAGPVVYDARVSTGEDFGDNSGARTHLYLYQDRRLEFTAAIHYPQFFVSGSDAERERTEKINRQIYDGMFYGYGGRPFEPEREMYGLIERSYQITRGDENLLSMRIYEYNALRGANHPNEWETALTLNRETGDVVSLRDIVGDRTPAELLDSGAFHCLQLWGEGQDAAKSDAYQLAELRELWADAAIEDFDGRFYLTEDGLGLIGSLSRYLVCVEAKLSDLGIDLE